MSLSSAVRETSELIQVTLMVTSVGFPQYMVSVIFAGGAGENDMSIARTSNRMSATPNMSAKSFAGNIKMFFMV